MGAAVRAINTASQFGILVCMPAFFTKEIGFELSQWLQIVTVMFLTNILFNLLFGVIGDKLGWRQTVTFFGGIGCGLATLAFYYVPLAVGPNLPIVMLVGAVYGATLAAFVPLSALMPSLAPERKGAAMSALNFGAGASAFLGPLVVTIALAPFGVGGVMWIYAGLYLISAVLAWQLRLPKEVEKAAVADRVTGSTRSAHSPGWPVTACSGTRRHCTCPGRTTMSTWCCSTSAAPSTTTTPTPRHCGRPTRGRLHQLWERSGAPFGLAPVIIRHV